jgi:hypothetical protein
MIQGVRSPPARAAGAEVEPTPWPQVGQNRAPDARTPPQLRQAEALIGAPQPEQKRPVPMAPQAAQVLEALVIAGIRAR